MDDAATVRRRAGWMPKQDDLETWLRGLRESATRHHDRPLHPALTELQRVVDDESVAGFVGGTV